MKIWHVGASSNPFRVDGVSRTVWLLSRHQAMLGHDVSLVIDTPPDPAAVEIAREAGIKLVHVHATYFSYPNEIRRIIRQEKPEIVHMHSVFIIRQATMARVLREVGIPYVITPHGGLAPQVLRRGVIKKSIYTVLRERPRFMHAAAVALVTPAEERAVRSFIPRYRNIIRWMPNPVETSQLDPHRWAGTNAPKRAVFLGRFDVLVKGIDILIEIARRMPEMQFDLYGTEDPKTLGWLNELRRNLPGNIKFNAPVFGSDKARALAGASFYIQPSRWEGFPVSVAECMHLGVPSVIADTLDLAQLFFQHDLGLVIPLDPENAVAQIRAAMDQPGKMQHWSETGQQFAHEHFHPANVAQKHIRLYSEVLGREMQEHLPPQKQDRTPGWKLMPAHLRGTMKSNVTRLMERSNRVFGNPEAPRTVVLCYHSINKSSADLSIDPAVFKAQIISLRAMGYQFLSFGGLVSHLLRFGVPRVRTACVTFDDGYLDNLTQAAPILRELNVPATTFVTTGLMQRDPEVIGRFHALTGYITDYLDARQIVELHQAGFEIGAHTHTHPNLAKLNLEQTREEIVGSRERLEAALGKRVSSFAYPFGKKNIHYTKMTTGVVRESGMNGAAAVAFRAVSGRDSVHVFEVPRFFLNRSDTMETFEQKVNGHFDWLGSIQEGTPAWLKGMVSPEDKY